MRHGANENVSCRHRQCSHAPIIRKKPCHQTNYTATTFPRPEEKKVTGAQSPNDSSTFFGPLRRSSAKWDRLKRSQQLRAGHNVRDSLEKSKKTTQNLTDFTQLSSSDPGNRNSIAFTELVAPSVGWPASNRQFSKLGSYWRLMSLEYQGQKRDHLDEGKQRRKAQRVYSQNARLSASTEQLPAKDPNQHLITWHHGRRPNTSSAWKMPWAEKCLAMPIQGGQSP